LDDSAIETPDVSDTSVGKEGIIIPRPTESRHMVINMNNNADLEFTNCMLKVR
jgi:hypothetical protein